VLLIGLAVLGATIYEHCRAESIKRGPLALRSVVLMQRSDGGRSLAVFGTVRISRLGRTGAYYDVYRVDAIDAATGKALARLWWDRDDDPPDCRAGQKGRLWCRSSERKMQLLNADTLEKLDLVDAEDSASAFGYHPSDSRFQCSGDESAIPPHRMRFIDAPNSARKQLEMLDHRSTSGTACPAEYIAPSFLCDHSGQPLILGASEAFVIAHWNSLLKSADTRLELSAATADCQRLWHVELEGGSVVFAGHVEGVLVLAVGSPDRLLGLDPESGQEVWRFDL